MTLDKSLKVRAGSIKSRNVLTRAERLKRLKELGRWEEGSAVLGIPKTRVVKVSLKKKKKVKKAAEKENPEEFSRVRGLFDVDLPKTVEKFVKARFKAAAEILNKWSQ